MTELTITATTSGQRLDTFLTGIERINSRSEAQRLISTGMVTLDGATLKKNHIVQSGQNFKILLPEPELSEITPQNIPIDIRYEDEDVIVINKPKGLVVHPAAGHPDSTLVNALLYHCGKSLSGIGGVQRPGIVHRIDKDTSGLLIVAKNDFAHQNLSEQLKNHSLSRIYEALVVGIIKMDSGTIDYPIGRHQTNRKKMAINVPSARNAVTYWEVIKRYRDITYLRCKLQTGRTHQIRVHMASISHPILGDTVYGGKSAEKYGQHSQCLHARELKFIHPRTGKEITVSCELPEYFTELLKKLEKICN